MADAEPRGRRPLTVGLVSALVALLFFGWFITFGPGHRISGEPSAMEAMATGSAPRASVAPATVGSVVPQVSDADPGVSEGSAVMMSDNEARAALSRLARADSDSISFRGQWAAQVASKYVGIVDPQQLTSSGSHEFGAADIYAEHLALEGSVTGAEVVLLDSRTYGSGRTMQGEPFWVTVAVNDAEFTSADAIVAWCAQQFPELQGTALNDRCLPTQLGPLEK